jgi:hypothetical protein
MNFILFYFILFYLILFYFFLDNSLILIGNSSPFSNEDPSTKTIFSVSLPSTVELYYQNQTSAKFYSKSIEFIITHTGAAVKSFYRVVSGDRSIFENCLFSTTQEGTFNGSLFRINIGLFIVRSCKFNKFYFAVGNNEIHPTIFWMYSGTITLSVTNSIFTELSSTTYSPVITHRVVSQIRHISFDGCRFSDIDTIKTESLLNFKDYNTASSRLTIANNEFNNIQVSPDSSINGAVLNLNSKFLSLSLNNNKFMDIEGRGIGGAVYLKFVFLIKLVCYIFFIVFRV